MEKERKVEKARKRTLEKVKKEREKENFKKKSLTGGCRHINNTPIYLDNSYRENNKKLMTYYSNPIEGSKKVFHR